MDVRGRKLMTEQARFLAQNEVPRLLRHAPTGGAGPVGGPGDGGRDRPDDDQPVLLNLMESPSQRLSAFALYACIWVLRISDFYSFSRAESESVGLFVKWIAIDGCFIFLLPMLRIPWLRWSPVVSLLLFLAHVGLSSVFLFQTRLPFLSWLALLSKAFYGRELGLSNRRVNPHDLIHNSSLILGKQVVNILPEGSAMLNPSSTAFCLNSSHPTAQIPIEIHQTNPIELVLTRFGFDADEPEVIVLAQSKVKKMIKEARRRHRLYGIKDRIQLLFLTDVPGVYHLTRVVDESKLEVRPKSSAAYVVHCPRAAIRHGGGQMCKSDLANLNIDLIGTPPFRIKYKRVINGVDNQITLEGIQPDRPGLSTNPYLALQDGSTDQSSRPSRPYERIQTQTVAIPVNETLQTSGNWSYVVEEIQDGLLNVVNYVNYTDEYDYTVTRPSPIQHSITVRNRPKAHFEKCNSQTPLTIAQGETAVLPVVFSDSDPVDLPLELNYLFTPEDKILADGEHNPAASVAYKSHFSDTTKKVNISDPGLYSLVSVSSSFCSGEVVEPASCNLQQAPQPDLIYTTEEIYDTCAGRSVGLRVHLRVIGTPPFVVRYQEIVANTGRVYNRTVAIKNGQHQMTTDLVPTDPESYSYSYVFTAITDKFYPHHSIEHKNIVLHQTVESVASAWFETSSVLQPVCLDGSIELPVKLGGHGPWKVEYDIYHGRSVLKAGSQTGIESSRFVIDSGPLRKGGEYTFALTRVTDQRNCPSQVDESVKVQVRMAKPRVAFRQLHSQWSVKALDGIKVDIPLALSGDAPFTLSYRNRDDPTGKVRETTLRSINDALAITEPGTFELVGLRDSSCVGVVDPKAAQFVVTMVPRPVVKVDLSEFVDGSASSRVKKEICEGDEDFLKLSFSGHQPFAIDYDTKLAGSPGRPYRRSLEHINEVTSVRMESNTAGTHEYKFYNLVDYNYPLLSPEPVLSISQTVHSRPTAEFVNAGHTYRYCASDDSENEPIPIKLTGVKPFSIEVEIRHSSHAKAERLTFRNINSTSHTIRLPNNPLRLGTSSVVIRSVIDKRGCQSKSDNSRLATSRVQVALHEPPTIRPLESQLDYCVGERVRFSLAGKAPFKVYMEFRGEMSTMSASGSVLSRVADTPGMLQISAVSDSVSMCKAATRLTKYIHPAPAARVSHGRESRVDIHEGGEAVVLFEFDGSPPFEYTYVRRENVGKGTLGPIIETRTATSMEHSVRMTTRDGGEYEIISIKDRYCSYSRATSESTGSFYPLLLVSVPIAVLIAMALRR